MSAIDLSSNAIRGMFYNRLEVATGASWIDGVSNYFNSDQELESYRWLGMTPVMREWIGGRQAKGFTSNGIDIRNKHFEATIQILKRDLRRDKSGQLRVRVNELADRAMTHWASLLSSLIVSGESVACYDGQFFFDTDHSEGASGTQDNDIAVDISALPTGDVTGSHGSTTAPSVGEMALSIQQAIQQIIGFKDDQGEPLNELAREFLIMCPTTLFSTAQAAVAVPFLPQGMNNTLAAQNDYRVRVAGNVRLNSSWTTKFAVFRTDGQTKPFIRQEEQALELKAKAEGSEYEFDNDAWEFGIDTWRNVGFGMWQHACLVTMT